MLKEIRHEREQYTKVDLSLYCFSFVVVVVVVSFVPWLYALLSIAEVMGCAKR